jgi:DHA3 family macrolide efflux protein-like MFS transporter
MKDMLQHRGLRLIFTANMISMIGSGMNSAAVTWFVLQATHSEMALGTLLMLQTIPALLMLPFTGVVIDREDRRRLVMVLDAARGLIILLVAVLAYRGLAKLWEVYLMSILVAAGFWMFWPTINALIQELTPESHRVRANSFLLAGFQCGWLIAGSMVGFVYNSIGLGGILFIDFASYVGSFLCYLFVRKGRHTVSLAASEVQHESAVGRFLHELHEGIAYIKIRPRVLLLGSAWALFLGGMLTNGVITAPFSDHILKAGAVGYGWLNGGWAIGACLGAFYTPALIRGTGHRRAIGVAMAVMGFSMIALPWLGSRIQGGFHVGVFGTVAIAVFTSVLAYAIMGCCRALGGVAIISTMMELVPKHFMGRVQNTFYFVGTCLQFGLSILVGTVAHKRGLAMAFCIVGSLYLLASVLGVWPVEEPSMPDPREEPAMAEMVEGTGAESGDAVGALSENRSDA